LENSTHTLIFNNAFSSRFEKILRKVSDLVLTLNQRVPGSSPTNKIKDLSEITPNGLPANKECPFDFRSDVLYWASINRVFQSASPDIIRG